MKITKIDISVNNLEESIKFYQDVFGCEVTFTGTVGIGKVANLKCDNINLALFESPKLPVGISSLVTDLPEGEDIDATIEDLKSKGARVVMEPTEAGSGKLAKVWDPNGISILVAATSLESTGSGQKITHLPNKIKD